MDNKELILLREKNAAQEKELGLELSLEKVRAQALAMRKPDDLTGICEALYAELKLLGFTEIRNAMINIYSDDKNSLLNYDYSLKAGKTVTVIPYNFHPLIEKQVSVTKKSIDAFYEFSFTGKELKAFRELRKNNGELDDPELDNTSSLHYYFYSIGTGSIGISTYSAVTEEKLNVLKRFRNVFDFAYRRYMDVAQAEAQAREAKIEAALERIRSRSMSMQKSEELKEVIQVVYEQFVHLNIHVEHTGFIIDYKLRDDMHIWLADQHGVPFEITIPYFDSPHWNSFNEAKSTAKDFFINTLDFEEKNKFYQELFQHIPGIPGEIKDYYFSCAGLAISTVLLNNVGLYIENFSGIAYSDEENKTLMRFGKVFQQTYSRFLDLQKAEAQVREAKIEAALERTRTQSMIMQHSNELDDTLRVFHEQVLLLGIQSAFSFLWLPDEEKNRHIFWAAWAENYSTVFKSKAINYPLDRSEPATAQCLADWKGDEPIVSYHVPPAGVENYFAAWRELIEGVEQLKPEYFSAGLYYVEAFMKYGCFGVMVINDLKEEQKKVLGRFAIEFERTYTRFLDLQKAEAQALKAEQDLLEIKAARKKAEEALTELRATQAQLIQSEKMASLGELTAGIAHEIQNPLNFVNNFSEVSTELVDEMNEEISKGNLEDAKEIAYDLKQNLEKINHHGKRAGDIVKGMLQHSRSNSAIKEPTDINKLADEYLRVAYHGLRAKDKTFNATLKTDFDDSIGNINIIPQDIGRVILNLITNAFYVVNEKKKEAASAEQSSFQNLTALYEPSVTVSTQKIADKVEIKVTDNGNGIPQKVIDKIFQPFFTTKPTGQGTGLGLSLSYDIVKAHGGELKVETRVAEGSTFIISLPLKQQV